jgi:hypothetical protein
LVKARRVASAGLAWVNIVGQKIFYRKHFDESFGCPLNYGRKEFSTLALRPFKHVGHPQFDHIRNRQMDEFIFQWHLSIGMSVLVLRAIPTCS